MRTRFPASGQALGIYTARAPAPVPRPVAARPSRLPGDPAPLSVPAGYRLVWSDEFDIDGLPDPARWACDTTRNREGATDDEQQYRCGPDPRHAVVRSRRLVMTARRESPRLAADWGGQRYTSTRLVTRGTAQWTYGFFEVRARLPSGRGTRPAIGMPGDAGRWPRDGALEIMAHAGHERGRVSSAVHMGAAKGTRPVYGAVRVPAACTRFHDYQMHWTREGVSFGVDGFVHLHCPRPAQAGPWPFDAPRHLVLDLAIGSHPGSPVDDRIFPVRFEIEHVRVYQAGQR